MGAQVSASRFFSLDSPKAIKAQSYGYLNAINYMAPASTAGVGNLCPHASPGCLTLCLGWYSGQAGMLSNHELETGSNAARRSRQRKAQLFMRDRPAFMREMVAGVEAARRRAQRDNLKLCVRLNGATDIAWERINIDFPNRRDGFVYSVFDRFPGVQFVDYTKSVKRALAHAAGKLPANYHLTFSRSEANEADCLRVLEAGGNVAVVFADTAMALQSGHYLGHELVNGDAHDLRHLDKKGGVIVALSPKGRKAKADVSGFVVRCG